MLRSNAVMRRKEMKTHPPPDEGATNVLRQSESRLINNGKVECALPLQRLYFLQNASSESSGYNKHLQKLIIRNGESSNSSIGWAWQLWVPRAFKLDHFQPIKPLLFPNFHHFFFFILGGQFLLPQRANYQKRAFIQPQNWMGQRGLGAWGIQTGPFAAH